MGDSKDFGDKINFEKGTNANEYHSFNLNDDRDVVEENKGEATVKTFPAFSVLETGAPINILNDTTNNTVTTTTTTTDGNYVSTIMPEISTVNYEEKEDEIISTTITAAAQHKEQITTTTTTTTTTTALPPTTDQSEINRQENYDQDESEVDFSDVEIGSFPQMTEQPESDDYEEHEPFFSNDHNVDEENDQNQEQEIVKGQTLIQQQQEQEQQSSSSIMDEVKQRLTELFSFKDDSSTEKPLTINANFKRSRQPFYTSIDRNRNPSANNLELNSKQEDTIRPSQLSMKLQPVSVSNTILHPVAESSSSFHKDLMDSVVYATSTSTEISHETEICYRGRCVKSIRSP